MKDQDEIRLMRNALMDITDVSTDSSYSTIPEKCGELWAKIEMIKAHAQATLDVIDKLNGVE